jgi:hypothetical protein
MFKDGVVPFLKHHTVKTYGVSGRKTSQIFNLNMKWEIRDQFHAAVAFLPSKEPPLTTKYEEEPFWTG